jgi:hypothetical protein
MTNLGDSPLIKKALNQSRSLTAGMRDTVETHNSGITTLLKHVLKAQAELYKGQLAVIEHFIGKLDGKPAQPATGQVRATAARTSAAPTEAPADTPASHARTTLARAIASAAAAAPPEAPTIRAAPAPFQQIRPAAPDNRAAVPGSPTPLPSK